MGSKFDYHKLVDYDIADPAKVLAQKEGLATAKNMPFGFSEVSGTRGESAYVFDMGDAYGALVQEGLGTKSLIAQQIYADTGKSYFPDIAQDTVACIINDLISVGATPVVSNAYWSSSSYRWLEDNELTESFIKGWRAACDKARVTWGGGETQSLSGIIIEGTLELAGSGFGVINDKKRLVNEDKLKVGDVIVLIESNGIHANGASLCRQIADNLKDGYSTKLESGITFGEALLKPTIIYTELLETLYTNNVDIHYLSNITGHGWRKIMRSNKQLSYEIDFCSDVDELFEFIQKESGNSEEDMYGNYNMGAGYAIYVDGNDVDDVLNTAKQVGLKAWKAGRVAEGNKQVVINPKNITFTSSSLALR